MDKKFTYKNQTIDKKQLRKIILWAFTNYGITTVSNLVDTLKIFRVLLCYTSRFIFKSRRFKNSTRKIPNFKESILLYKYF